MVGLRVDRPFNTLPESAAAHEPQRSPQGGLRVWLENDAVRMLAAARRASESYSDVILRLVEIEAGR